MRVNVEFYTQYMDKDEFHKVPKSYEEMQKRRRGDGNKKTYFGQVTGTTLIEAMEKGILDGGTVGESSFVYAVSTGRPIVVVAMLSHDTIEMPGRDILMRKGVVINRPEDFKDKVLISRYVGPGDSIFLKEFLDYYLDLRCAIPGIKNLTLIVMRYIFWNRSVRLLLRNLS